MQSLREIKVLKRMRHQNVVQLIDVVVGLPGLKDREAWDREKDGFANR